jgi:hypothetical protein
VSRGQEFVGDLLPKPRSFVSHSIASAEKLPSRLEILTKQRTLTQAKLISKPFRKSWKITSLQKHGTVVEFLFL